MGIAGSADRGPGLPVVLPGQFDAHVRSQEEMGQREDMQATMDWLMETNPELLFSIISLASSAAQRHQSGDVFSSEIARNKEQLLHHSLTVIGVFRKHVDLVELSEFEEQFAA